MGYTNKFLFFHGAFFVALIATTTPLGAYGQLPNLPSIVQAQIGGQLVCSGTGNVVTGITSVGVANATVFLECPALNGSLITVNVTTTTSSGSFTFIVNLPNLGNILSNLNRCRVRVPLPVVNVNCTLLPTTGSLIAAIFPNGFTLGASGIILLLGTRIFSILGI